MLRDGRSKQDEWEEDWPPLLKQDQTGTVRADRAGFIAGAGPGRGFVGQPRMTCTGGKRPFLTHS